MTKKKKSPEDAVEYLSKELMDNFYRWHRLKSFGGDDPFWTDGYNMQLVRNHIISDKCQIKQICDDHNLPLPPEYNVQTPPEVPFDYMSCRKDIINAAINSLRQYLNDENYQWLLKCNLSDKMKKQVYYDTIINYPKGLETAINDDDLVVMRRHKNPTRYLESFAECRKKIEELIETQT